MINWPCLESSQVNQFDPVSLHHFKQQIRKIKGIFEENLISKSPTQKEIHFMKMCLPKFKKFSLVYIKEV